jgi:hypothetical protein
MSKLVKTRHQAKFKDFKGFGAFKGLVEQKTLYLTRSCVNWAFFGTRRPLKRSFFAHFPTYHSIFFFRSPYFAIFCFLLLFIPLLLYVVSLLLCTWLFSYDYVCDLRCTLYPLTMKKMTWRHGRSILNRRLLYQLLFTTKPCSYESV